ncbi:MAG: cytochrome c [Pseudorhodoplanes sp.]|nr:cytochrome c [Pseudorhodoplanes sp.]
MQPNARVPGYSTIAARLVGALLSFAIPASDATAQSVQRGTTIARTYCSKCHSIDRLSPSPLAIAPPFRDLHKRYPVESLAESLAEGIVTGHPTMPEYRFEPDQVGDLIAFMKTLE